MINFLLETRNGMAYATGSFCESYVLTETHKRKVRQERDETNKWDLNAWCVQSWKKKATPGPLKKLSWIFILSFLHLRDQRTSFKQDFFSSHTINYLSNIYRSTEIYSRRAKLLNRTRPSIYFLIKQDISLKSVGELYLRDISSAA